MTGNSRKHYLLFTACSHHQHDLALHVPVLEQAVRLDPSRAEFHLYVGRAAYENGELADALAVEAVSPRELNSRLSRAQSLLQPDVGQEA